MYILGVLFLTTSAVFFAAVSADILPNQSECGLQVPENVPPLDRIIGGNETYYGEFPWLAALNYKNKINQFSAGIKCGGCVISERFILTAAHCLHLKKYTLYEVWLGVRKISEVDTSDVNSARKFEIETMIPHEQYSPILKINDIALLKLKTKIKYSIYIRPVCLPEATAPVPESGTMVIIAGWGQPLQTGPISDQKLKVDVPVYKHPECEEKLGYQIRSTQICAEGEVLKGTCWGDGGGPLMKALPKQLETQWFSIGLISSIGCSLSNTPNVHTRVSSFVTWITDKVYNTYT